MAVGLSGTGAALFWGDTGHDGILVAATASPGGLSTAFTLNRITHFLSQNSKDLKEKKNSKKKERNEKKVESIIKVIEISKNRQ